MRDGGEIEVEEAQAASADELLRGGHLRNRRMETGSDEEGKKVTKAGGAGKETMLYF